MGRVGVWGKSNQTNFKGGKMTYHIEDIILAGIIGLVVGFILSMAIFFRSTDIDYFELRDQCKGVIGIVEDGKGVELEFECVGGYENN